MNITIYGTGSVGQTLATKLNELGHNITMGTRDVEKTMSKSEPDSMGNLPVSAIINSIPSIKLATFADAKKDADILILSVSGGVVFDVLDLAGELPSGLVVLDNSNPLDFSKGFPPTLLTDSKESLSEKIQAKYPNLSIVKCLNTMSNAIMVNPRKLSEDSNVFLAGNNGEAKLKVKSILAEFGWKESEIIDTGDITKARGLEMILPLWVNLFGVLGTPFFNFKIVK